MTSSACAISCPVCSTLGQPQDVQLAAVAVLGSFSKGDIASLLLARWPASTPAVRAEIVLAMLGGRDRVMPLLEAIEKGDVPANQIPFARRALLLRSPDEKVKALATRLFGDTAAASRHDVIAKYRPALTRPGDPVRGREVFQAACAACHRAGDLGQDVGPNLATIRQWSPEQTLLNILDPNREVAPNFIHYVIETKDGRTVDGMIAEENASSVTLKRLGGVQETVLRRDIARLQGSSLSLMPEGLEAAINVEQMADLLAFLLAPP